MYTIMNQEEVICCRMGSGGIANCLITLPLQMWGPFGIIIFIIIQKKDSEINHDDYETPILGGFFYGLVCGMRDRLEIVRLYDIDDSQTCQVGEGRCLLLIALLYPCNTFQMHMALRDFEKRGIKPGGNSSNLKTNLKSNLI